MCEQEAAPVAEFVVVNAKLMAVIAQCQRFCEVIGQWLKAAEMRDPFLIAQRIQPDGLRRSLVAIAQDVVGKYRRGDHVVEFGAECGVAGRGAV